MFGFSQFEFAHNEVKLSYWEKSSELYLFLSRMAVHRMLLFLW